MNNTRGHTTIPSHTSIVDEGGGQYSIHYQRRRSHLTKDDVAQAMKTHPRHTYITYGVIYGSAALLSLSISIYCAVRGIGFGTFRVSFGSGMQSMIALLLFVVFFPSLIIIIRDMKLVEKPMQQ